jgi:hypothetical protein
MPKIHDTPQPQPIWNPQSQEEMVIAELKQERQKLAQLVLTLIGSTTSASRGGSVDS